MGLPLFMGAVRPILTYSLTLMASPLASLPDHFPRWARELAQRYFTKTIHTFLLHGNVRDLVRSLNAQGQPAYVPMRTFIQEDLFYSREIVVFYDRASGITFNSPQAQADFSRAVTGFDSYHGTDFAQRIPRDPVRVMQLLENYFRLRLSEGKRMACVFDFAETIAPMAEASMYSPEDRAALVALRRWAHDTQFSNADFTLLLITENLRDLNQALVQNAYTSEIEISMPTAAQREEYLEISLKGREEAYAHLSDVTASTLAQNTAGLGFVQLRTLLADVFENATRLTVDYLAARKKELIEAQAYGLIEFIETDYNLDMVAGHTFAKRNLRAAATALRNGRPDVLPMGYLVNGPVGTGKTFLISCFAGDIGIPMVKLKNFRSQWQGVTEGNLEKILALLRAMTPVAVMIDEADAMLGDRNSSGDSGVSSRVFGQIATFMSDTRNRGRVIFFLLTARPDLMPIDLKRQGRAEEHIALFYPESREEREELLQVMLKKTGVKIEGEGLPELLFSPDRIFSGADMEALLTRAKFRAASEQLEAITPALLEEVILDFLPPTYPMEVELQTLAAVLECTSRDLLPPKYRDMSRELIVKRVEELKRYVR